MEELRVFLIKLEGGKCVLKQTAQRKIKLVVLLVLYT